MQMSQQTASPPPGVLVGVMEMESNQTGEGAGVLNEQCVLHPTIAGTVPDRRARSALSDGRGSGRMRAVESLFCFQATEVLCPPRL